MIATRLWFRDLFWFLLITGTTVIGCLYYWVSLQSTQAAELETAKHRSELRVMQLNEAAAQQLDATVRSIDTALRYLRTVYVEDRKNFDHAAKDVLAAYPQGMLQFITVFGADGYLAYSSNRTRERLFFGDREHFRIHADSNDDQLFVSKPITGRIANVPLIQITRVIRDGKRFLGVIGVPVRPDFLSNNLKALRVDSTDLLSIIRLDGTLIARSQNLEGGLKLKLPPTRPFIGSQAGERGLFRGPSTIDKLPLLFSWQHLSAWPLIAVAAINEEAELGTLGDRHAEQRRNALLAMAVSMAFSLAVAALLVRARRKNDKLVQTDAERMKAIAELHTSEEKFAKAFRLNPMFVSISTVAEGRYIDVNENFLQKMGRAREEVIGHTSLEIALWKNRSDRQRALDLIALNGRLSSFEAELCDKFGEVIFCEMWAEPLLIGDLPCVIWVTNDISERKRAEDEIQRLAFYDSLTRLPNRRLLMDRLRHALASSARNGRNGALLFIDLDNFKTLNDTLGHDKGDLLLQQAAERLVTCVREGDTVARLGGDEFVVMLEDLSGNPEEAATQTESVGVKILVTFNEPYLLASRKHHSTPSIGVTLFSGHQNSIDDLLKQADLAMYQAKAAGRNTLRFYDAHMQATVTARAALEVDLREAVAQQEFVLYYQPQVVGGGRVTGAEALVRWQHPLRGLISPSEFISLSEETGLILPLGYWVLKTACVQLAAWAARPDMSHLSVAVNVSAYQFHRTDFVDQVLAVLDLTGADPRHLKLELTESLLVSNVQDIIAKMALLKAEGVGFSLDDFGTGYSSLSHLKRLPLDQLKIDQGFVKDILVDPNDAAIAKMIVVLAESMGITVIAEGVEFEAQRELLAGQGCHAYQGYLFSRPLPLDEFEAFVKQSYPAA